MLRSHSKNRFLFSLGTLLLLAFSIPADARIPVKVLFIGNSLTYFNDMPQVFRDIANQKGDTVDLTMYAPGGTGFQHHYVDPNVFDLFRSKTWDVIVLQPGSGESGGVQPRPVTLQQARKLIDSARHYSPCARILFYEISNGVTGTSAADVSSYNNTMNAIRTTATYLADSTKLSFAPAGECLRYVWNQNPSVLLWNSAGDIHPNIKGSYLVSCAMYAAIFHKQSTGTTIYNGNTAADAGYYQHVADSIVLMHSANWRIDTGWHRARFTYVVNQGMVQFQNTTTGHDSLRWWLAPQQSTTTVNPVFNYTQPGTYPVKQVAYFGPCTDTVVQNIVVGTPSSVAQPGIVAGLHLFPNPAREAVTFQVPATWTAFSVRVTDAGGRVLLQQEDKASVNVSLLPTGIYFLKATNRQTGQYYFGKLIRE